MKCYKHFPVQLYELYTTVTVLCCNPRCQYSAAICDLSNVVAFGHNELWRPRAANNVCVTSQLLWPSATTNCGGWRPQKWLLSWLKYPQLAILGHLQVQCSPTPPRRRGAERSRSVLLLLTEMSRPHKRCRYGMMMIRKHWKEKFIIPHSLRNFDYGILINCKAYFWSESLFG